MLQFQMLVGIREEMDGDFTDMKKIYHVAILSIAFFSCGNNDRLEIKREPPCGTPGQVIETSDSVYVNTVHRLVVAEKFSSQVSVGFLPLFSLGDGNLMRIDNGCGHDIYLLDSTMTNQVASKVNALVRRTLSNSPFDGRYLELCVGHGSSFVSIENSCSYADADGLIKELHQIIDSVSNKKFLENTRRSGGWGYGLKQWITKYPPKNQP